jgi:hypothetical protein
MESLLLKGHDEQEVIEEFDKYYSSSIKKWSFLGVIMIILAVLYWFIYQPEFGRLRLDFDSRKYWYRFNEHALKPFFILSLLITGISTVINKNSINRAVRTTMISVFSISIIICISVYSSLNLALSLLFAVTGIILFSSYEIHLTKKLSNAKEIISNIKRKKNESYSSNDKEFKLSRQVWKGSAVFLYLILSACLFVSLKYDPTMLDFSGGYKASFKLIDQILMIGIIVLSIASIISAILININFDRFKPVLIGLMILSGIYVIVAMMHSQFQETIYPGLLIIVSGAIALFKPKLKLTKKTDESILDRS